MFIFLDGGLYGCFFFFFQAEDGIRDYKVTGVQTCALPIYPESPPCVHHRPVSAHRLNGACWPVWRPLPDCCCVLCNGPVVPGQARCWTGLPPRVPCACAYGRTTTASPSVTRAQAG